MILGRNILSLNSAPTEVANESHFRKLQDNVHPTDEFTRKENFSRYLLS